MQVITQQSLSVISFEQVITPESVILSDLDGTVLPLAKDPAKRFIDPNAYRAFVTFNKISPGHVIPITGRDREQVLQSFHNHEPKFSVISSNGAQLHLPGGTDGGAEHSHPFTLPERNFIHEMRQEMAQFKIKYPALVAEVKRFEIGRHVEPASGYGHVSRDDIRHAADICDAMMERREAIASQRGLNFTVASTEVTHREMSHRNVDKLQALRHFADHLPRQLQDMDLKKVVYLGDSLLKGNDRVIAAEVIKQGGKVLQVVNGVADRIPPEGDAARPDYAFEDPAVLGSFLVRQIDNLRVGARATPRLAHG